MYILVINCKYCTDHLLFVHMLHSIAALPLLPLQHSRDTCHTCKGRSATDPPGPLMQHAAPPAHLSGVTRGERIHTGATCATMHVLLIILYINYSFSFCK